jgi:hypothetical protein
MDGGTEVPPLQSKGNRRGKGDNKSSHKDKSRSSDSSDTTLALGLLFAAERRPGPKGHIFASRVFRSLKATAPSDSLTLKRQGARFAL